MANQLQLGVNVDHVATLRQARGTGYPSPVEATRLCAEAGAYGVTVHLREDRRHIQDHDVETLCREKILPVNLEMANSPAVTELAIALKPAEACLVPEHRRELTTEGGLDVAGQLEALRDTVGRLGEAGIEVSLFVEADPRQLEAAARLEVPVVELHTGAFCDAEGAAGEAELKRLIEGARIAHALGLRVNAGHGINMDTVRPLLAVPYLETLNIGHSIVARAVFVGMHRAVREMMEAMAAYQGGEVTA
jgi:pyridoxine 5-phosphate synthase